MFEFNMLAFVLCSVAIGWLPMAHRLFCFCEMYLNGSWTYRSAGIFEGRHIWEVHFWDIFILYMFRISTHVYIYICISINIYIYIMLECNMLAFVLCCNWLVAHGPPAVFFL